MSYQVLVNGALHVQTSDSQEAEKNYGNAVERYPAADIKLVEITVLRNRTGKKHVEKSNLLRNSL